MKRKNYLHKNVYKFEKILHDNITLHLSGERYGPYLYKNIDDNEIVASWVAPDYNKRINFLYSGEEIGYNKDAIIYSKNKKN